MKITYKEQTLENDSRFSDYEIRSPAKMIMIYLPKKAISGPYITILKLDMITKFMIEVEYYESDTTEKAFIFAGVNPKNYDLFHEKINVSKSDWNFKDAPLDTVYNFRENKWQY